MAAYFQVRLVCDRCGCLLGSVEIKFGPLLGAIEKQNLPEGCVPGKDNDHYCTDCAVKYKEQLGL
jgi:hypothetical protein